MKIFFFTPNFCPPTDKSPESYEFYNVLHHWYSLLTDNYKNADYILYMMHTRNCLNLPYDDNSKLDIEKITEIFNSGKKEIIIDYNDWTDTRNVPNDSVLKNIYKYFKRSVVKKENYISSKIIEYPREIIPISYGIRSDFIEYDKIFDFTNYNYDICCLFDSNGGGIRSVIPNIVTNYNGTTFTGRIDCPDRYSIVNIKYFEILKTSKIIVTANPPNWEGDFRLWEALLMGNLVLCDKMLVPSVSKHPLIDKKHLVYYNNINELKQLMEYYIDNNEERIKIGNEGREYCLKYHKFSDRVTEVLDIINKTI
jgi:hypothetical protein